LPRYGRNGEEIGFDRQDFVPALWDRTMGLMSGYLLTDTATSLREEGCYSVAAYVGMDQNDNIFLLDLRVGHMTPQEFIDEFLDVLQTWQKRVNHVGEVWETISLTTVFQVPIEMEARRLGVRLNPIEVPRANVAHKKARIQRLLPMFQQRKFRVVDTVPQTYKDASGQHTLWNPTGHADSRTGMRLPSGELVSEFTRLGSPSVKDDIADALALLMEVDRRGARRLLQFRNPKPVNYERAGLTTENYNGTTDATSDPGLLSEDWWSETIRRTNMRS